MTRLRDAANDALLAWQFLTRLPAPGWVEFTPARMAASLRYYPAVGALIGVIGAVVLVAAEQAVPIVIAVLLSIAVVCAVTGALHEDGLADSFDGIGGGADRARALEIMRDSRIGTYGTVALVLVLALKAAALATMPAALGAAALVAGHGASRLSSVVQIATSRYARPAGTAGFSADGLERGGLIIALVTGALCLAGVVLVQGGVAALGAVAGLAAGHVLARAVFARRLGGYTGDTLGATQQLSEVGLYLGIVACL